jgi:hypothetical protein
VSDYLPSYEEEKQEWQSRHPSHHSYNQIFFILSPIQPAWQIGDSLKNSSFFAFTHVWYRGISFLDPDPVDP